VLIEYSLRQAARHIAVRTTIIGLQLLTDPASARPVRYCPPARQFPCSGPTDERLVIYTVRRYALHGICDSNSVCLSVRPSVRLPHSCTASTWFDLRSRRGSPRASSLNDGGVGTNWRFSTNKPPYLRNGARYDKGYY